MPARRAASTYSIAGLTYENGCSASNTKGRLTSENQNRITHTNEGFQMPFISVGKENTKDIEIYYKDWGRSRCLWRSTTRTGVADSPSSSAMAGQKALCQWKTASPLFVAIAKRFRGAGL